MKMSSTLIRGTAIITIGLFLSKALGLLYLIPLYAIVGKESMALYQYAYVPYNLFLSIAVSGAPLAISKYVSKYNTLGDYETGRRLMKSGMVLMMITGITAFVALFLLATPIAGIVNPETAENPADEVYTIEQVATVIRWVSFSLIVVPLLSLTRGFFQGYNKMEPTAVSQLVEQIVRILFVLGGAAFVVYVMKGTADMAINVAVFAAFIGAIAGLLVLYKYWQKYRDEFDMLRRKSIPSGEDVSFWAMYKEVFGYLIPFVLVGTINPMYQAVDMLTFKKAMASIGLADVSHMYLGMINLLTHKFVMIPVMVATGFSMALIPVITGYFTGKDRPGIIRALDQTFQIMLFLTIPMVLGLMVLSDEFYTFLYEKDAAGASILAHYAPVAILFGMYSVTAAILQGIDRHKWIIFTSMFGLWVKMVINIPFIQWFEANGAIYATAVGYFIAVSMNVGIIMKVVNYRSTMVIRRLVLIVLLNVIMIAVVYGTLTGLRAIAPADGRWIALLYVLIGAAVGAIVYGVLAYRTGLLQRLLGDRITRLVGKFSRG